MNKTSIYLPDDLKQSLSQEAKRTGQSEAALIRKALMAALPTRKPKPTPGIFAGKESVAERADELLTGFGQ
ncbi:MAG: CopG family transcriptional regulator [Actinomycetaceae bacterium]|nr:CopG family transcriptional regulator [Actinomycetaceae bacterium]